MASDARIKFCALRICQRLRFSFKTFPHCIQQFYFFSRGKVS